MASLLICLALLVMTSKKAHGQMGPSIPIPQSSTWNSSFHFSASQLSLGNLTSEYGSVLETIINYDRTQLANGGTFTDGFYNVSKDIKVPSAPGQLIKLEEFTDPRSWSIPAATAMSRIIYSTQNINGTLIPASAYVLWPYQAKQLRASKRDSRTAPVVLWTHGTSGFYASGAPSARRDLFYNDFVPYTLALAGYVVVAPDYAGLGVARSWNGDSIPHQYLVRHANAGDALNAFRAAKKAFPTRLTDEFVSMGHSQGGAVAWGLSELLARKDSPFKDLIPHHLGTVLAAPPTDWRSLPPQLFLPWTGKDLDQIYPTFNLSSWLTPLGVARTELLTQVEGSQKVSEAMFFQPGADIVAPGFNETAEFKQFLSLVQAGRQPFKGPMMIIQGTQDPAVPLDTVVKTVQDTCRVTNGDLELMTVDGAGHFGGMNAARLTWLAWIEDRFERRSIARRGCGARIDLKSFLPIQQYQSTPNSFLQWAGEAEWMYELPTAA